MGIVEVFNSELHACDNRRGKLKHARTNQNCETLVYNVCSALQHGDTTCIGGDRKDFEESEGKKC